MSNEPLNTSAPSHLVGLGASAGGLESLERFFGATPPDTGMAFVVIQHLAPDHKSLMSELLRKHTEMVVTPAAHGALVERNHVYLIPPRHNVEVREGKLVLTQRMDHPQRRPNYAVDQFFRSLALDYAERAIGVVLSGTGSDGSHGSAAIKAAGGFVLAEDPASAKFGTMPRSTIDTGVVSAIKSAAELPAEILRHVGLLDREVAQPLEGLEKILSLVSTETGIDFNAYKRATVGRRIDRRRATTDCTSLEQYANLLERSSEERASLGRDLLVGVTAFFRDREAFGAFKQRLAPLVSEAANRSDRTLRVWVAACSTGEEAYSVGIACFEMIRTLGADVSLKIFATDVNDDSLAAAGNGRYPFSVSAEIDPELLQRYFTTQPDGLEVRPFLREAIVFARHDILHNPPFTRIDVLSCRNMLIYFAADAQKRAKNAFRFALRPGGLLFLGSSETLGPEEPDFTVLDEHYRFYSMTGTELSTSTLAMNLHATERSVERRPDVATKLATAASLAGSAPGAHLLEATLEWMGHTVLIINADGGLAYASGSAAAQLRVPAGRPGWKAADLLPEGLNLVVSSAVEQALRDNAEVVVDKVPFRQNEEEISATIRAVPLGSPTSPDRGTAVFIEGIDEPKLDSPVAQVSVESAVQSRVRQLEDELRRTRAQLLTTVEELEASNEELQATNEELIASNEELQSTNEELQSLNEELHTVNAELQAKVEELSVLSTDLGNLLRTMGAGLLFLDVSGRVRRYNERVLDVVPLVPHDVGRPIADIAHSLVDIDLGREVHRVVSTGVGTERDVLTRKGRTFALVLHPFEGNLGAIEGVVVTLTDVTKLHAAREKLRVYSLLVEQSPSMSVIADASGAIEYANPAYSVATGLRPGDLRGRDLRSTLAEPTSEADGEAFRAALESGEPWTGKAWLKTASTVPIAVKASLYGVRKADGTVTHLVETAEPADPGAP